MMDAKNKKFFLGLLKSLPYVLGIFLMIWGFRVYTFYQAEQKTNSYLAARGFTGEVRVGKIEGGTGRLRVSYIYQEKVGSKLYKIKSHRLMSWGDILLPSVQRDLSGPYDRQTDEVRDIDYLNHYEYPRNSKFRGYWTDVELQDMLAVATKANPEMEKFLDSVRDHFKEEPDFEGVTVSLKSSFEKDMIPSINETNFAMGWSNADDLADNLQEDAWDNIRVGQVSLGGIYSLTPEDAFSRGYNMFFIKGLKDKEAFKQAMISLSQKTDLPKGIYVLDYKLDNYVQEAYPTITLREDKKYYYGGEYRDREIEFGNE